MVSTNITDKLNYKKLNSDEKYDGRSLPKFNWLFNVHYDTQKA